MADQVRDFPLFPLGIVALPHELVPLHIFEERYKTMIGECLEHGSEFGIVWAEDDGLRPVGCAVEIAEVLERMDDGRLNILTRGTRPFRIVDRRDDLPYPVGTIEQVLERLEDGRLNVLTRGTRPFRIVERQLDMPYPAATVEFLKDKRERTDEAAAEAARAAYAELVVEATDQEPDPDELASKSAYEMAATVDFGLDAKQGLLDLRSETARLRLVTRLFRAAVKRLDFIERAQARARSNGKVRFG